MSLLPAFELGLWNAWIIEIFSFVAPLAFMADKERMQKRTEGEPTWSEFSRTSKVVFIVPTVIMPFTLIYSIFLPLKVGTAWFYAGIPICFLALLMHFMTAHSYSAGPVDEPMTRGVRSISRHPCYFSIFLVYTGIGIACASWVFLLCALAWIVSWHFGVVEEERVLLQKYGDAYREYMDRTPRWIGIPRSGAK